MPERPESFGTVLRRLRRAARLSQEQLASQVGVDFTYISKLENDRTRPPAEETVRRLGSILKPDSDELVIASKKIPSDLGQVVSSKGALDFLRSAEDMKLTDAEWKRLSVALKRLR